MKTPSKMMLWRPLNNCLVLPVGGPALSCALRLPVSARASVVVPCAGHTNKYHALSAATCTACWIDVSFPRRSCMKKASKRHKTRNVKGTSNLRRRHASVVPFPGRVYARCTLLICCCMSCDCTIINDFPFRGYATGSANIVLQKWCQLVSAPPRL